MGCQLNKLNIGNQIGFKVASALLMHNKEVSVDVIRAIPFFTDVTQSESAIEALLKNFDAEKCLKPASNNIYSDWEEVIRLKK